MIPDWAATDRKTGFFGPWREGQFQGQRVGFIEGGGILRIEAGVIDPDQEHITDLYLSQVGPKEPLPSPDSPRRLDSYVGSDGAALIPRYILNATGGNYPELRIPAVREGLLRLSRFVEEVQFYESGAMGLRLRAEGLDKKTVESDVAVLIGLLAARKQSAPPARPIPVAQTHPPVVGAINPEGLGTGKKLVVAACAALMLYGYSKRRQEAPAVVSPPQIAPSPSISSAPPSSQAGEYSIDFYFFSDPESDAWRKGERQTLLDCGLATIEVSEQGRRLDIYAKFEKGGYAGIWLGEAGVAVAPGAWQRLTVTHDASRRVIVSQFNGRTVNERSTSSYSMAKRTGEIRPGSGGVRVRDLKISAAP